LTPIRTVILLLVALACPAAQADILFVDTNLGTPELEVARRVAEARGEQVIVIPEIPDEVRARARLELSTRGTEEVRAAARLRFKSLIDPFRVGTVNSDRIATMIRKARAGRKATITSVIVSGHSDGDWFTGELMNPSLIGIQDALELTGDHHTVEALYALGCYTTTIWSIRQAQAHFPRLRLMVGYSPRALSSSSWINLGLLERVLGSEDAWFRIQTSEEASAAYRAIPHLIDKQTDAGIWVNSILVDRRGGARRTDSPEAGCPAEGIAAVKRLSDEFARYMRADEGYEDPPANVASSSLRSLYSGIQEHRHCPVLRTDWPDMWTVQKLIFFKNTQRNFGIYAARDVSWTNRLLERYGAPPELRIPDYRTTEASRRDVLATIDALKAFVSAKKRSWAPFEGTEDYKYFTWMVQLMETTLRTLECTPFAWNEPLSHRGVIPGPELICGLEKKRPGFTGDAIRP
ncbi:MAG TPA: hypothetical protein VM598_02410, partial [Bdellovibrionota bacterium]|nr:hypothetical protein [Bdellovibrionota bacterium]